jgi:hypothetical protein
VPFFENTQYIWSLTGGGILSYVDNQATVDWNELGVYYLSVTPVYTCGNGPEISLEVHVGLPPEKPVISGVANVLTSSVADGIQWYYNGEIIPNANDQTYVAYFVELDYTVSVTTACGIAFSEPYNLLVSDLDQVISEDLYLEVYPNPSNSGKFEINLSQNNLFIKKVNVLDTQGRMIFSQQNTNLSYLLDLSRFRAGLYTLIVETENTFFQSKIIIK